MRIACFVRKCIRNLRLIKVNRELLVFFVFFIISVGFWFLQTFNENASTTLSYKIKVNNIPPNIIITSAIPEDLTVSVTGKGFDIIEFVTRKKKEYIEFDYSEFFVTSDAAIADNALIRRAFVKDFEPTIEFVSCTPSKMELFYSAGEKKRVPVIFKGKAFPARQYMLCGIKTSPDSVDIYAKASCFDSIFVANTIPTEYHGLKDSLSVSLPLVPINGVKYMPDSVNVDILVDLFTEKSFKVPVICENVPDNLIMRTFPLYVTVSFNVVSSLFDEINEDDFVLVVNYDEVKKGGGNCDVSVRAKPDDISQLRISPDKVDFIIEERRYGW